jgi:hypothetical protein
MDIAAGKVVKDTHRTGGSALIMVVVLTVLLAAIGILFVMASRVDEMASSSVVRDHDLDCATESVVELISQRLLNDVTDPRYWLVDYPAWVRYPQPGSTVSIRGDLWLSTIEPTIPPGRRNMMGMLWSYQDDAFLWRQVSDITGQLWQRGVVGWFAGVDVPADANDFVPVPADADGDGIVDSVWTRMPGISGSRGEPVFVAVRIIDNCGMLNLNTTHQCVDSLNGGKWPDGNPPYLPTNDSTKGKYLSSVDYFRFLRGQDRGLPPFAPLNRFRILAARDPQGLLASDQMYHEIAVMHVENPGTAFHLFDIADELEIRNRCMLTSLSEARFERDDVANFTLDAGGGRYGSLEVPVVPGIDDYFDAPATNYPYYYFDKWKWRMDPNNFDSASGAYVNAIVDYEYKYDRRHVCTFYSFDRNMRTGVYLAVDQEGRPGCNPVTMIFDPGPLAACTNFYDSNRMFNSTESREKILRMLYALRAYYLVRNTAWDYKQAARRAAQTVANMIDYTDDNDPLSPVPGPFALQLPDADGDLFDYGSQTNDKPTFIDRGVIRSLILEVSKRLYGRANMIDINTDPRYEFGLGVQDPRETVYGYERQPFISEIARDDSTGTNRYAVELCNPYDDDILLDGWRMKIGAFVRVLTNSLDPSGNIHVPAMTNWPSHQLGRLVLVDDIQIYNTPETIVVPGMVIGGADTVELQRPDPRNPGQFITVDWTKVQQSSGINGPIAGWRLSRRDDTVWKFANAAAYANTDSTQTLGKANGVTSVRKAWQMPVKDDNEPIGTLLDFERVLSIGNERDPNGVMGPITERMGAGSEGSVRTDVKPGFMQPSVLDYICFMSRPEGSLPGRININTATKEVIRAAIPPNLGWSPDYDRLAANIVDYREQGPPFGNPYRRISDLLNVTGFDQLKSDPNGVGDPDMRGDIEERDWILSMVANIFTVRSDVFTAYILVRVGHDGPQRRMIAIFDRTNVDPITQKGQKVQKPRLVALHPVPDPR